MRAEAPAGTVVILLVSTNRKAMAQVASRLFGDAEIQFVPADGVQGASFRQLVKNLRGIKAEVFAAGVRDLRPHQQHSSLLKGLTFLPRAKRRMFVDEEGRTLQCTFLRFASRDVPLLVAKFLASLPLIMASYLILLALRGYLGFRWKGTIQ